MSGDAALKCEPIGIEIADAYRTASLAGARMRHVAGALERFEDALARGGRPFAAWDLLDDIVGRAYPYPDFQAVTNLRRQFAQLVVADEVRRIATACAEDAVAGVHRYIVAAAEAITFWRPELHHALALAAPRADGELADVVEMVRTRDALLQAQRWPEVLPLCVKLAAVPTLPADLRGPLYATASRIVLFHVPGGWVQAKEFLTHAVKLAPDNENVLVAQGELLLSENDIKQARQLAEQALEIDRTTASARIVLGDCLEKQGDIAAAEENYREAIRARPGKTDGYRSLIKLAGHPRSGVDPETIPSLLQRAQAIQPWEQLSLMIDAGDAYKSLGRFDDAEQLFRAAIDLDPDHPNGYTATGYLLHELKRDDEAQGCFERLVALLPGSWEGFWGKATIAAAAGKAADAERWYRIAAARAPSWAGRCRACAADMVFEQGRRDQASTEMLEILAQHAEDDWVLDIAESMAGKINQAVGVEQALQFCGEVLEIAGEDYQRRYETVAGDLYLTVDDHAAALPHFLAAVRLDDAGVSHYLDAARVLSALRDWDGGRELFAVAPEIVSEDGELRAVMARMRNAEANERYVLGEHRAAAELYRQAIALSPSDHVLHSNLAGALERDTTIDPLERIDLARAALVRATELAPDEVEYSERLRYLELAREFSAVYGTTVLTRVPLLTPIALEVAVDLVPLVEGEEGRLAEPFGGLVAAMRERIFASYGVNAPGLRVRGNERGLPPGGYTILLEEIPIRTATILLDRRLAIATTQRLAELGVVAEATQSPADGADACWVDEGDWARVEEAGVDLWDVSEYPLRHLQAVLENNLADLLDHQETSTLLVGTEIGSQMRSRRETITPLTATLRALLAEQVPINALTAICARFTELFDAGERPAQIVEQLRMLPELRARLPGNHGATTLLRLGDDLAGLLSGSIHVDGDASVLALLPDDCQNALEAIRDAVTPLADATLVVDDVTLRPLVRALCEIEFPRLWVLSRRELLDGLEPAGAIHLGEPGV